MQASPSDSRFCDYRFNYRQADVLAISGSKSQQLVTSELHPANDYYGQATILKRYAGIPLEHSLKLVVEHGIHLDDIVWSVDMDAPLATILSCTPWRADVHRKHSNKQAIPIGFGYLYARELVRREHGPDPTAAARHGTLAFPCHSTHSITANFDHHEYAERLLGLPPEFQPVYLCGYWKDILDGNLSAYEAAGIPLVSCGHMYDTDFMLRFHDLCRQFRYAVSNSLGTHLFQAVASGCRFFFLDSSPVNFDIPLHERAHCGQFHPQFQAAEQEARRLFHLPTSQVTRKQQQFVDAYLGTDFQRSPGELRRLIRQAEWRDRMLPISTRLATGETVFAPPALARRSTWPAKQWRKLRRSISKRLPLRRSAA